jgi:hypothetical protein
VPVPETLPCARPFISNRSAKIAILARWLPFHLKARPTWYWVRSSECHLLVIREAASRGAQTDPPSLLRSRPRMRDTFNELVPWCNQSGCTVAGRLVGLELKQLLGLIYWVYRTSSRPEQLDVPSPLRECCGRNIQGNPIAPVHRAQSCV